MRWIRVVYRYRYRAEGLMLMLMLMLMPVSAVTIEYKARGQTEHWLWSITGDGSYRQLQSQACGGGVLLYSSGCSSSRGIESAVAGKKGVDCSGKL